MSGFLISSYNIFYFIDEIDFGEEEEGGGDSVDGGLGFRFKLKIKVYKMIIYWVFFLD